MKSRSLLATAAASGLVLTPLGWIALPAAQAAGPGEMSVHVRNVYTGAELPGIQVTLYNTSSGAPVATRTTPTDNPSTPDDENTGSVYFEGLEPGTYTAKAHDPSGAHSDKYSTGEAVTADDPWAGAGIAMTPIGTSIGRITGQVSQLTDRDLDAYLEVYPSTVTTAAIEDGTADYVTRSHVYEYDYDSDGGETVTDKWQVNVAPGSYKVRAVDRDSRSCEYDDYEYTYECTYTRTAWVGGNSAETATALTVTAGKASVAAGVILPAEVVAGTDRIAGTVTGAGGVEIDDVEVDLLQRIGDRWIEVANDETGADGTYGFSRARDCELVTYDGGEYGYDYEYVDCDGYAPVGAGTFTLRFSDEAGYSYYDYSSGRGEYATVYFGNVPPDPANPHQVPATASTVTLGDTGVQTANASMTKVPLDTTSGLYGKVADDKGTASRGTVYVYDLAGNYTASVDTRRDGTWALPVTSLAPGQYKLRAGGEDLVSGWVGGQTFKSAVTHTVPVKGAANAGSAALARYAELSGTIGVAGVAGTDTNETTVTIWNAKGRPVDYVEADEDGRFSASVVPGTYLVSADGEAYDSFDVSDAEVSRKPLIERFWRSSWTVATATRILAGSGAKVTGVNLVLSDQLVAAAKPRITGQAKVGKTVTASAGVWNETENVTYKYVWKRGSKVVGTKAGYKVTTGDKGKTLTVTVTAVDASGTYRSGSTSAAVKVPS